MANLMLLCLYLIVAVFVTDTERRIRANDRAYNSQFNYAVSETALIVTSVNCQRCHTVTAWDGKLRLQSDKYVDNNFILKLF